MIMVTCVPEMIPTDSGLTDCTVTVTDAMGNIPSNLVRQLDSKNEPIGDDTSGCGTLHGREYHRR